MTGNLALGDHAAMEPPKSASETACLAPLQSDDVCPGCRSQVALMWNSLEFLCKQL